MQTATEIGTNHSGMDISPTADEMLENTELTEPRGDEREAAKVRAQYGSEADPVGTLPQAEGPLMLLMDKLGERLAFERSGTRLYDALMVKCKAAGAKIPAKELQHIRDEEAMHFALCGRRSSRWAATRPSRRLARMSPVWRAWASCRCSPIRAPPYRRRCTRSWWRR